MSESNTRTRPWSPGLLSVVVAVAVLFWVLLLGNDGRWWILWLVALLLPGAAVWPLASRLFHRTPAVVLPFSLALGGMLLGILSWTLASLRILPFQSWSTWLLLILLAAACWIPRSLRSEAQKAWRAPGALGATTLFLVLFIMALGAWAYVRGMNPAIDGLEKFMDYGFMMSLSRSDYLPAADPWLAGGVINYYYFGQFFYTLFVTLSFVPPAVGYNLALASTFAYLLTLAAGIGWQLSRLRGVRSTAAHAVTALATAFFVGIAGNAHAFFYAPNAPGQGLLKWAQSLGIDVGKLDGWFYPQSTRFIGYNPDTPDKTIHEFPFYSFLVADLHAHLVNTVFVLLFLGLLVQFATGRAAKKKEERARAGSAPAATASSRLRRALRLLVTTPLPLYGALAFAVFLMGNYWDLVIYYVALVAVLLVVAIGGRPRPTGMGYLLYAVQQACVLLPFALFGSSPVLAAITMLLGAGVAVLLARRVRDERLTRLGATAAATFALAHLVALPFSLGFDPISRRIALAQAHTPLWQLLVLWGPQLLILIGGLVAFLRTRPFANPRPAAEWIVVGLGLCAVGLIAVPEIVYVVDIYENGYARANTMFKLTYQASLLLGLVIPFVLAGAWIRVRAAWLAHRTVARRAPAAIVAVLGAGLAATLVWYPFAAMPQAVPSLNPSDYRGLDGAAWMSAAAPVTPTTGGAKYAEAMADDATAIAWLNREVSGQPVIVEAAGASYTHFARISSYTGLPTVLGWETHEWLWRTSASQPDAYRNVVAPRANEIEKFYTQPDATAADFLKKYDVKYIVIGQLERSRYAGMNPAKLEALGEVVFTHGTTEIIRVR